MRLRLLFLFLLASIIANSQYINRDGYTIWTGRMWVGSGTSVTAPPSNVWLQLGDSATTKALWLPRVQNLTDIPTPKQGMIVYNISDSTVYYRRLFSWTAIGSGGGGSGITQLGTSPFGLIRLNDSTYLVDSMQLITKYQSEKSRDSLGALIAGKQATLVSGTNIKTINGNSLLGSGDLVISGSSDSSTLIVDTTFTRLAAVISTDTLKLKSIRVQLNGSTVTPTVTDSTASWNIQALVAADTASLSSRINLKLNISDTTSKTWDWGDITGKPTTVSGYGITDAIDSLRRVGGSVNVEARKNGVWVIQYTDSVGSGGGGGSPAGNYGNVQLNRNGAFATPASDSLDFDAGLNIKGALSATALPTGGADADSLVVINSSGAFKKRNASSFLTGSGTSAQVTYWSGTSSLTGNARYTVGTSAPWLRIGSTASNSYLEMINAAGTYSYLTQGSGPMDITGSTTYNKVRVLSSLVGSTVAEFYRNTTYNRIDLHGAVSCDDLTVLSNFQGAYHIARTVPYASSGNNYHGFTDGTDFRQGNSAFNSFGTFVNIGNNRTDLDHYAGFQTVWGKDSTNKIGKVYDFVSAVSEMKAGTIDSVYRFKVFEMTKTGGTIVRQYGIQIDNLTAATTNIGAWIYNNVGIGPTAHTPSERLTVDGNGLFTGTITTGSSGSGAGAWKLGVRVASSGLTLDDTQYIEISIGGTVYKLALVNVP